MQSLFLLDTAARGFTVKEKIGYFLVALFFITLFLPDMPVLNNIAVGAIVVHSFFYNTVTEKRQLFRQRKEIWLMLLFYLFQIVSALLSVSKQEGINMLVLRLPLLLFPLSLGLLDIRSALKDRIWLCFAVITTLTALVCLGWAFSRYRVTHEAAWLYDDSLTMAIRRQSIYFALIVLLALFGYVYLLRKPSFTLKYRWLAWLCVAFLIVFLFLLASRIALTILFGCMLLFAASDIFKKKNYGQGVFLVVAFLAGAVILVEFFPKTINRFRELKYTNYTFNSHAAESHYNMNLTADQWNGANIRLAVWSCGWDLVKQHWLIGVPLGDKQDRLMDIYRERQFDFGILTRRNMHNTYLDVVSNLGIIGLAIFILGYLVFPLIACYRRNDLLGLFTVLAFAVSMTTESYFDRSIGCLLAALFLSFIAACQKGPGS
jgi:O-antigen ligase